jgi:hypothetical protein
VEHYGGSTGAYPEGRSSTTMPASPSSSRNIRMQRIYERACEVRLSAAVGQEQDIRSA